MQNLHHLILRCAATRAWKGYVFLLAVFLISTNAHSQRKRLLPRPESPIEKVPEWGAGLSGDGHRFVFFDSAANEFVLEFPEALITGSANNGRRITTRFQPEFTVEPVIRVSVEKGSNRTFGYEYSVSNAPAAPAGIRMFSVVVPSDDETFTARHPQWVSYGMRASARAVAPQAALTFEAERNEPANRGRFVTWMSSERGQPIQPAANQGGFRIVSQRLPGITTAYAGTGITRRTKIELPLEVMDELGKVSRPEDLYRMAVTIGPRYDRVSTPAQIAADFQKNIQHLVKTGLLSKNSAFVTEALERLSTGTWHTKMREVPSSNPFEVEIRTAMEMSLVADVGR